jgi:hypothetical protein
MRQEFVRVDGNLHYNGIFRNGIMASAHERPPSVDLRKPFGLKLRF